MFNKVLIANRGEIARRVLRTLNQLGVASVAVYSDSDAGAPHTIEADEAVWIGPDPGTSSYLRVEAIIAAAQETGADAIHPGYGFLAESLELAHAAKAAGITFVGPDELALSIMGDKAKSREQVIGYGVPVVPGFNASGMSDSEIQARATSIGFPLLIKPSAGGGGKGMEVVQSAETLAGALASARRVAVSAFGDDTLVLERLIGKPRHIEVQVFGDKHGEVIALGERECSLQRRHQKVIEEAPTLAISETTRARLFEAAVQAAVSVAYVGAGTVEFLIDADNPDEFFFIEMNTRLQVEHPVTEAVTGLDLVELQLRIAEGASLAELIPGGVQVSGHAVEARIYAESPADDFLPSVGQIFALTFGSGVRVDSAVEEGSEVSPFYDPMIAKMIAYGADRSEALEKLDSALAETVVLGVETNIAFLRDLINDERVRAGHLDTGLIDRMLPIKKREPSPTMLSAAAWAAPQQPSIFDFAGERGGGLWSELEGWRLGGSTPERRVNLLDDSGHSYAVAIDTRAGQRFSTARAGFAATGEVWVSENGHTMRFTPLTRREETLARVRGVGGEKVASPECHSPMPGAVVALHVEEGAEVEAGDALVAIEAMKMEHPVRAEVAGTVRLKVKVGDQVQRGDLVAIVESR